MSGSGFGFDEDAVREELEEQLLENHRQYGLKLLAYVYTVDPDEIAVDSEFSIPRGESVMTESRREVFERIKYILKTQGRYGVLYSLVGNLKSLFDDDEEHMILLFVELCEADTFLELDEPMVALLRGCSFLQKVLSERVGSDSNLASLIEEAYRDGVLSEREEQLAQFVRKCRNDAGHNFWLETEFSYVIHEHGAIALIALLTSALESWYGVRWDAVSCRLSVERCLRIVRQEFEFEWEVSPNRDWDVQSVNSRYNRR